MEALLIQLMCFLCLLWLSTFAAEHDCHFVAVEWLPLRGLFELEAKARCGADDRDLDAVFVEGFLPARDASNDAEILSHKLVAVHVNPAVDVDRIRGRFPDQVSAPDVWIGKRVTCYPVCFEIADRVERNTDAFLCRRR